MSAGSEFGAYAVQNANTLVHLPQLLESPSPDVVRLTCRMLADIASHKSLNSIVQDLHLLTQLVPLLK
jgi:hypothetical protein